MGEAMTPQPGDHTLLLQAERAKHDHLSVPLRALPVITGIGNLFLLAFAERYLAHDPEGLFLTFLLFLEASCTIALAFLHYNQSLEEILQKTRIFPPVAWSRFLYALNSLLRNRSVLALWGSAAIGLAILNRAAPALLITSLLAYFSLSFAALTVFLSVLFWFTRYSAPATILAWIGTLAAAGVMLSSLLFRFPSLLEAFLPVVWAADAIREAAGQDYLQAGAHVGLLLLTSLAAMLAARLVGRAPRPGEDPR
jgi:hypothetical protein